MVRGVMRSSFCAGLWGQLRLNPGNVGAPGKGLCAQQRAQGAVAGAEGSGGRVRFWHSWTVKA